MPDPSQHPFAWPRFIITAYGPTLLSQIGYGAITPLVVLSATSLGASAQIAALLIALLGVGTIVGDLPASVVATRLGERMAIVVACLWDAVWLFAAFMATSLPILAVAVFSFGLSGSVFGLARQNYITEAVPERYRARMLSTLGGSFRIGAFIGPLVGAWVIVTWDLQAAYAFAAVMSLTAAGVTLALPDLPSQVLDRRSLGDGRSRLFTVLRAHGRTFMTLGVGMIGVGLARAVRQTIVPLWCDSLGMAPEHTSLVYALSMGVDMSLFFLGGYIMDRFGRVWVVVPSLVILGLGLAGIALTHTVVAVSIAAAVLGFGNGIGSGMVMSLGSDASPDVGRAQFLSGWRLFADSGTAIGPTLLSALTGLFSLATATISLGGFTLISAIWMAYWLIHSPHKNTK